MQDDLDVPIVSTAGAASAAEVSSDTIRTWFKRGDLILGESDMAPEAEGFGRKFSGRTVLVIAIMAALTKLRIAPELAASAAVKFAHSGDEDRDPGHVFADGRTFLVVGLHRAEVIRLTDTDSFMDVWDRLQRTQGELPLKTLLELDDLVHRVRAKLGLGLDRGRQKITDEAPTGYADRKPKQRRKRVLA